ncbi:hypothetical protein LJR220_003338 [Bradyrhizobium sp. LjRoot220]|uniref:hypothetical protein n=1 Tax=Bradyrhizobium sp. LjRoot220 TaxID=3342284 RepID=UPI003ECD139F
MNLRAIANSVTSAVSPNFAAKLFISTGHTTVNFKQVPAYDKIDVVADVQALSSGDLRQLDSLNVQGAQKAIYLNGAALGISRIKQKGGDLIVFANGTMPEGNTWLVLASLEQWGGSTWCKVAVSLQDDIPDPT